MLKRTEQYLSDQWIRELNRCLEIKVPYVLKERTKGFSRYKSMCTDKITSRQRLPAYALSKLSLKHNAAQTEKEMLAIRNGFMNVFIGRKQQRHNWPQTVGSHSTEILMEKNTACAAENYHEIAEAFLRLAEEQNLERVESFHL